MGSIKILGGRGMLGSDIVRLCKEQGRNCLVFDLPEFDITRAGDVEGVVENDDIIINCAAYTNVDGAESEKDRAWAVNADAVGVLGKIAKSRDALVVHISTDFVFDGEGCRLYTETDEPAPLNVYGRSKLAGEEQLLKTVASCCIIRVEWTYGASGNNFVNKILTLAGQRKSLRVVDDQVGSPTWTLEAGRAVLSLIDKEARGLFHFAADGYASRYEVATYILEYTGSDTEVLPCGSDEFPTPAQRPANSRFNCDKIKACLDEPVKHWKVPLGEYLELLAKDRA
jgi:dTDP-4-dehydrorhamnose reductase